MKALKKFFRLLYIKYIFLKYGLDRLIWSTSFFRPLNFFIIFFPWRWFSKKELPTGESIRLALEELGPIFVKFGQLLSVRGDLLPDDIAAELAKLQDKVPPFSGTQAKKMIEASLGYSLDTAFSEFNTTPLASASIAQVHPAVMYDGRKVIIKVLRPNIHKKIAQDVGLLETLAKMLYRYVPNARRFRPIEVVQEFKSTLFDELDLLREAANASQLRRNFIDSDHLYVPQIIWEHSRKNVLTMEQIFGIPIADLQTLKANNTNLKRLAERGVEIFFTQVFRDCFFHADMHPGNVFVSIKDPEYPQYMAIDFGIMGTLGPDDQRYLGENFLAFFKRDYRRVAELHVQSGWVPPHTRVEAFESAIRTVCEPIFERPLKDISIGQTLLRLFQTARRFNMEVQPQLVLLQKTLLTVEGLGRQLYPDLDLWQTAKPFLEKWMRKQFGSRALFRNIKTHFPIWSDRLPDLPEAICNIAQYWQNETHYLKHQQSAQRLSHRDLLKKRSHHVIRKILGGLLIAASALLIFMGPYSTEIYEWILSHHLIVIGMASLMGIYLLFKS